MTDKRKLELEKEILTKGYTQYNFICSNGNCKNDEKPTVLHCTTHYGQEGAHWGNNWVLLKGKWAEFKPGMEPVKKEIIENNDYLIY